MPDTDAERIGKRLVLEGLVSGSFGNISLRTEKGFLITRIGVYLDRLGDLVFVPFDGSTPPQASSEHRTHREIYAQSQYRAVVHAHPPHAVTLSFVEDTIIPRDSEGILLCPEIPVITGVPGSPETATEVASALRTTRSVIVRGHGTFAAGYSLDEAYTITAALEHSCRIILMLKMVRTNQNSS